MQSALSYDAMVRAMIQVWDFFSAPAPEGSGGGPSAEPSGQGQQAEGSGGGGANGAAKRQRVESGQEAGPSGGQEAAQGRASGQQLLPGASGCSSSGSDRVVVTPHLPLYFQHEGHSRTIIGIERRLKQGELAHCTTASVCEPWAALLACKVQEPRS